MDTEPPTENPLQAGQHLEDEKIWLRLYDYLKQRGYLLRARYRPGWKAPWPSGDPYLKWEEGLVPKHDNVIDAKRISDGLTVILKHVPEMSPEIPIGQYLSSPNVVHDPRNHAVPFLDVFVDEQDPKSVIVVTPLLRELRTSPPASVRECVDFVQQTLEGLAFLHERKIAHRDCAQRNIMMDGRALFPRGWHPQAGHLYPDGSYPADFDDRYPSRTAVGGVRYYFIDFGISTRHQLRTVGLAGVERAPELSNSTPYDPYKVDVWILGTTYRQFLVEKRTGTEFLTPLIERMTQDDPDNRPTVAEATKVFDEITEHFGPYALSQRVGSEGESALARSFKDVKYRLMDFWWVRTVKPADLPPFL